MKLKLQYIHTLLALFACIHQAAAQNLFEASSGNGNVYEFTTNGVQSTFVSGLHSPHGLAFDSAGDLFVADTASGNVLEFTNNGGVLTSTYFIFSSLHNPDGLAFNSAGNLFASDYSAGDIYEFTNNAGVLSTNPVIFASGLNPHAMAFNSAGILFAGNGTPSHIYEFTTNGMQSTFVSGVGNTYGLAFDGAGNLFAANSDANTVLEFTNNAGLLSTNPVIFASGIRNPFGLVFNNAGILFVGDNTDGSIYEYTTNGVQSTFVNGSATFSVGLAFQPAPATSVPFTYTTNNGTITITGYTGSGGAVTIPGTINGLPVTAIGNNAFERYNLTTVTIPNSVTSIGDDAFSETGLTNVTIGNSVTNLGVAAFTECDNLTSVIVGNGVSSIGGGAFGDCVSLTNIMVNVSNLFYSSFNGVLFDKAQTTLLQFPGGLAGSYTVPNGVTSIGNSAFSYCPLSSVTIPDSVINIGNNAFGNCISLTNASIGSGVTNIEDYAFAYCLKLTGVYFQGNAPSPANAFYQDNDFPGPTAYYLQGATGWGATFDGIPTSVILPPPPALGISTYSGQPAVFFPTATGTNYVLQMTTNLANGPWVTVTNGVPINGLIITNPPGTAFFRLH